jgi:hypothetical protein
LSFDSGGVSKTNVDHEVIGMIVDLKHFAAISRRYDGSLTACIIDSFEDVSLESFQIPLRYALLCFYFKSNHLFVTRFAYKKLCYIFIGQYTDELSLKYRE